MSIRGGEGGSSGDGPSENENENQNQNENGNIDTITTDIHQAIMNHDDDDDNDVGNDGEMEEGDADGGSEEGEL